jgi:phosphate/sulfate permease
MQASTEVDGLIVRKSAILDQEMNPRRSSIVVVVLAALIAAALPILVAIALLVAESRGRGLLSWPRFRWLVPPRQTSVGLPDDVKRVTFTWSLALIVVGVVQGVGAALVGLSVFDPVGFTVRLLGALLLEAVVYVFTQHHTPQSKVHDRAGE